MSVDPPMRGLNDSARQALSVPDMRSCRTSTAATTTQHPFQAELSAPGGVRRNRPHHLIGAAILGQAPPSALRNTAQAVCWSREALN